MKKYIVLIILILFSIQVYAFLDDFKDISPEFSQAGFDSNKDKVLMSVDNFGRLTYFDFIVSSDNIGVLFNMKDEDLYVNNIYVHYSEDEKIVYLIAIDDTSEIRYKGKKLPKMDPGSLVTLDNKGNLLEMRYTSSRKGDFINPIGTAIVRYTKDKDKETYVVQNGELKVSGLLNLDFFNGKAVINSSTLSLGDKDFRTFGKEILDIGGKFSAIVPTDLKLENSKISISKDRYLGKVISSSSRLNLNVLTGKLKENTNLEINGLTELNINSIYANIKPYQATFINSLTGSTVRINQLNIEEFLKSN